MIEVEAVTVTAGGRPVLRSVSLTLAERRIGVIGPNGSGKSTLARVVGGLATASEGRVRVDGLDPVRDGRALRARVGFLFADPDAQVVMPTVREDVAFSLRRSGLPRADREARVAAALDRFGLSALADAPAHRLSSGEKQLLALASSLVRDPQLLICDEPTTLLDLRNARAMTRLLLELPQQLLLVTHDLDLVGRCDRVVRLEDGLVVDDGPPDVVVERYRREMA